MNENELRQLKPGDITVIDGHIAWIESVDENRIVFLTCSILKENNNEKDETDKSDQLSYQDVIG